MKKTRFMAIVLVVAVMLMGAGYAVWTQDFTLNANVETGNLDLNISLEDSKFEWYRYEDPDNMSHLVDYSTKYGLMEVVPNVLNENRDDIDEVTLKFSKLFPGATARMQFKIENVGSLPAAVQSVKFTNKFYDLNKTQVHGVYPAWTGKGKQYITGRAVLTHGNKKVVSKDFNNAGLTGMDSDGTPIRHQLQNNYLSDALNSMFNGVVISNNEIDTDPYILQLFIRVEDEAKNDITECKSIESTLKFNFIQGNFYDAGGYPKLVHSKSAD